MDYSKPPISFSEQISKLKKRGLKFEDETKAESYLSNISYYRLRAYTYPFQDNKNQSNHSFIVPVTFEEIIELYRFDRQLSKLVFDALQKIEIALRTQIVYQWAMKYGSHWQLEPSLYRDTFLFKKQIENLQGEIERSDETFIKHYKETYSNPSGPPSWMSLEVSSFGLLSKIFSNLKKGNEKEAVTNHFGLKEIRILENWMHCFSNIRNICAHHSRLWNRSFATHIMLPTNPKFPFIENKMIYPFKLYAALCCIQYLLNTIIPANGFKVKLMELINQYPLAREKEIGFPLKWKDETFWR